MKDGLKQAIPEFLATTLFFLVACYVSVKIGIPSLAGLVWGGSLGAAVLLFGGHNAAHCNPAVTLGMLLAGRTPKAAAIAFWVVQLPASIVGIMLASLILTQSLGKSFAEQFIVRPGQDLALFTRSFWIVFGLEAVAAFFLTVAVIFGTDKQRSQGWAAWLIIGSVLGFFAWGLGPVTGGAINPVRALGPWIIVWPDGGFVVTLAAYVVGTLLGGLMAGFAYRVYSPPPTVG